MYIYICISLLASTTEAVYYVWCTYIYNYIYLPYEQADVELPAVVNGGRRDGSSNGDPVVGLDEAGAVQVVASSLLVCIRLPGKDDAAFISCTVLWDFHFMNISSC